MINSIVYNEDCMIGLKKFPDHYFDLALCDIPYGLNVGKMAYLKESKRKITQKNGAKLSAYKKKIIHTDQNWDSKTPDQDYFDELKRVSKNQIIFGVDYVDWTGLGSGRIKWNKGMSDKVSFNQFESAYCSLIDEEVEIPLLWSGMLQAKSLKEPMVQQGNKKLNEKRIHPCHKPVLLYLKLIMEYGFDGCKIIDTHVGGGSSRIAAKLMNCDFTGFEIDEKHFNNQEKRWMDFSSQLTINF